MSQSKTNPPSSEDPSPEKDLTIAKAAFLMLRVRKVLKKKVQKRKEERERKASVSPRPSIAPFDTTCESLASSPEKPIRKFNPKRLIRSRTMPAILAPKSNSNDAPRRHSHQHCQRGHQPLREAISSSGLLDPVVDHHRYGKGFSIIAKLMPSSSGAHHSPPSGGKGEPKPMLLNIPQQYHYHQGPSHPHNHKLSLHEPNFSSHSAEQGLQSRTPQNLGDTINDGTINKQPNEGTKRNRAVSVDMVRRGISLPGATSLGPSNASSVTGVGGQQSVYVTVPKKVPIMPEGLVEAVEQGDSIKADRLLTTNDVDINSVTGDGLTLLEIAVIQGNQQLVRLLQTHGATENQYRAKPVSDQLHNMAQEAEKMSELLMTRILKCSTFGNLSTAELKELEKEFNMWEKRYKRLKKMRSSYSQIRPPEAKLFVAVDVIGNSGVRLRICEDSVKTEKLIFTKYRIEWGPSEKFPRETTNGIEIFDLKKLETVVNFLKPGSRYFFRIAFGNFQGYGRFQNCTPFSVVPSSWRDVHGAKPKNYTGKEPVFDEILGQLKSSLFETFAAGEYLPPSSSSKDGSGGSSSSHFNHQARKAQKKLSIKTLFSTPKFHKTFTRGFFLSCVIYCENKILLTLDDVLPALEIDENFPSTVHKDFHWLLKVACNWEDVKYLKQEMEKPANASTFHTRLKILNAIISMQNTLGMEDLGRLYYKILRDESNNVVFISVINYLRTTKVVSALNVRWTPLFKLTSRKYPDPACDMLMSTIKEQILYHQVSNIPLGKGLYLGYLKLASSVDLLKIIVPVKTPNMLPHVKIRDNPHVSSEEWYALQNLLKSKSLDLLSCEANVSSSSENGATKSQSGSATATAASTTATTSDSESEGSDTTHRCYSEAQDIFRKEVSSSFKKLLSLLEVDHITSLGHRIYNTEVIEVSSNVSLLVVLPSVENVCLVAGQSDKLLHRNDLIALPIQVFEVVHLCTYQSDFISRYARLSTMLEIAAILAHHNQREAFSSDEVASAKHRTLLVGDLQGKTDSTWKSSRWVMDLVTLARAKEPGVLPIQQAFAQTTAKTSSDSIASIMSADAALAMSNMEKQGGGGADEYDSGSIRQDHHHHHHRHHHHHHHENLKIVGNTLKCSRSENILAMLGQQHHGGNGHGVDSFLNPPEYHSSQPDSLASPHKFGASTSGSPSNTSNTSNKQVIANRTAFSSGRLSFASHSQSETSISVLATQVGSPASLAASPFYSPSLHNLCKQGSESEGSLPGTTVGAATSDEGYSGELVPPNNLQNQDNVSQLSVNLSEKLSVCSNNLEGGSSPLPSSSPIPLDLITCQGLFYNTNISNNSNGSSSCSGNYLPQQPQLHKEYPSTSSFVDSGNNSEANLHLISSMAATGGNKLSTGCTTVSMARPVPIMMTESSSNRQTNIVAVYAAYSCGLAPGTCVRLQITNHTTARQIVNLFVKHLSAAVLAKGLDGPIYDNYQEFCLVAVIGARERVLRLDFKPMHLQKPWDLARLYCRKKTDVTAAILAESRIIAVSNPHPSNITT